MRPLAWLLALVSLAAQAAPVIVERDAWGAREPAAGLSRYGDYDLDVPPYDTVVLHITAMGRGTGKTEMQRVQDYQMQTRGFADIAYNYLVDSAGTIFAGRPLTVVPAHAGRSVEADERHDITLDPDYGAIGIVFSADRSDALTSAQVASATGLIRWLQQIHPVTRVVTHAEIADLLRQRRLTPRQPHDPAVCPGVGTISGIVMIRQAVDPRFDAEAYRATFTLD